MFIYLFSSRRRHTRWPRDWSSDVCSSDLVRARLLPIGPVDRMPVEIKETVIGARAEIAVSTKAEERRSFQFGRQGVQGRPVLFVAQPDISRSVKVEDVPVRSDIDGAALSDKDLGGPPRA